MRHPPCGGSLGGRAQQSPYKKRWAQSESGAQLPPGTDPLSRINYHGRIMTRPRDPRHTHAACTVGGARSFGFSRPQRMFSMDRPDCELRHECRAFRAYAQILSASRQMSQWTCSLFFRTRGCALSCFKCGDVHCSVVCCMLAAVQWHEGEFHGITSTQKIGPRRGSSTHAHRLSSWLKTRGISATAALLGGAAPAELGGGATPFGTGC